MLTNSDSDAIVNVIIDNLHLFDGFDEVYIFGSILNPCKKSNDIDLLLLYSTFSSNLIKKQHQIANFLEKKSGYPIDITALSVEEEKGTKFISKLNQNYMVIKKSK